MLIAQISDLHIGFDRDDPDEFNLRRLRVTLAQLGALKPRPDLLVVSGDLVDESGGEESYRRLAQVMQMAPAPVLYAVGNHDARGTFAKVFPDVPENHGFVQYAVEKTGLRVVVCDTLQPGRHGGAFCDRRAAWLRETLADRPEQPTLIVMHHPPFDAGLSWMNEEPQAPWIARFEEAVAGANLVGVLAGHLHRPIVTTFAGAAAVVCPSTAPQVALDLAPIDPEQPDDRPMIVAEAPAYALHLWRHGRLVTHFGRVEDARVLARYSERLQPLVRKLLNENYDADTSDVLRAGEG